MQKEMELLRKAVHEMHRMTEKQTKRIEELKAQVHVKGQLLQDREAEIASLKQQSTKQQSILSSVEGSILCQICMEPPVQPFALSPCGHVLCLTCLQEWFKSSPGNLDNGDGEDSAENALTRVKTCPCCRTIVGHRPTPIFMVKAVTAALLSAKPIVEPSMASAGPSNLEPIAPQGDPWTGIFPDSDAESDQQSDSSSQMGEDEEEASGRWLLGLGRQSVDLAWSDDSADADFSLSGRFAEYDSTSSEEDSPEPTTLVEPQWEPAALQIDPHDYDIASLDGERREVVMSLLRRGCSWGMIQNFHVRYTHSEGIVLTMSNIDDVRSGNPGSLADAAAQHSIFLGWNVVLDEEDTDGERFMHSVLFDIRNRPERWRIHARGEGAREIHKLVDPNEPDEYVSTDSDGWPPSYSIDADDSDDD